MRLRLLLDENCESKWLADRLRKSGHDVACLKDLAAKGVVDEAVLYVAKQHDRVLYTRDREFVERASRAGEHSGIILEFLTDTPRDMTVQQIVDALKSIEKRYADFSNQLIIINSFKRS
ncbi:MAG TPA: DUF5615 family PIN-like protein [Candidatus Obscuribacterales bacterium]